MEHPGFLADARSRPQARDSVDAAMGRAVAALQPGWMMLTHCPLGGPPEPPAPVRYALVHPKIGIALLDIIPDRPTPEPAERLRRALERLEFRAIFGGWPPAVYRRLAPGQLSELGIVLAAAFASEAPLALDGGETWVGGALRALTAPHAGSDGAPAQVAEPRGPERASAAPLGSEARAPRRERGSIRVSALLCGCLVVSTLGGALLLSGKGGRLVRTEAVPPAPPTLDPVAVPVLPPPESRLEQPTPLAMSPVPAPEGAGTTAPVPAIDWPPPQRTRHPPPRRASRCARLPRWPCPNSPLCPA